MALKPNSLASRIVEAIRDKHARNSLEIHYETGIPKRVVSGYLGQLEERGLIKYVGTYPALAGDSASVAPMKMYEAVQDMLAEAAKGRVIQ